MRAPWLLRLVLLLALGAGQLAGMRLAWAQPQIMRESAVKAAFLYKFAGFVEWPRGTFAHPDQPLVIAISGNDQVADELVQLTAGRTVEGRPISVRQVSDGAALEGVHVLYLGSRTEARLKDALQGAAGPVLIVTEQAGALRLGSVINFSQESGRVRFSASLLTAEARNLRLSARLLAVAQVIKGRNS